MKLKIYEVNEGDTFWGIADDNLGDGQLWRDIFILNAAILAENIGDEMAKTLKVLTAGTQLILPDDDGDEPFEPSGQD